MTGHRYPLEALVAASGLSEAALGRAVGLSGTTLKKARETGLSWSAADRYATRVGQHPSEVWPEWVDHGLELLRACDRCGERFVPVRVKQRWCSTRCRNYSAQAAHQRRRWAADPVWAEAQRERVRRYRAETAEYQRAQAKVRYQRRKRAA